MPRKSSSIFGRLLVILVPFLMTLVSYAQVNTVKSFDRNVLVLGDWKFQGGNDQLDASGIGFNDKKWTRVSLPHSWVTGTHNRNLKYSNAWYRTEFRADRDAGGKQVFLLFERVSINAEVFVNGVKAGSHKGAMNAFIFNITEKVILDKVNSIAVKVSNEQDLQAMPANYAGGMLGQVKIIYTSAVHIDPTYYASSGVFITPRDVSAEKVKIDIRTLIRNFHPEGKNVRILHRVEDGDNEFVATGSYILELEAGSKSQGDIGIEIDNPRLWDTEHPELYRVSTELWVDDRLVDRVDEVTGFRDIRLTSDDFWINGKTEKLYGANYCHPSIESQGSAISNKQIREDLDDMKNGLGLNTVRFAHWPFPKVAYTHSDSIGLIVMTENGYAWHEDIEIGPEGERQTLEMVFQNYNHPSIVFWSSGNENPHPGYYHYSQTIRSADSSRIIVCVDDKNDFITSGKLSVPFDHHDAVFQNKYIGWYEGEPWDWEDFTKVIHMLGEAGSGSLRTNHGPYFAADAERSKFEPEEWAQLIFEALFQTAFVNCPEQIDVLYIWHYRDVFSGKYKGYNTKGLLAAGQFKKDMYYFYQSFLKPEEDVLNIVGKHWYIREGEDDIKVYSNSDELELFVNGTSKGSRLNGEYKHIIYGNRIVNNTFYWFDALQTGRNEIRVIDGKGNEETAVIYLTDNYGNIPQSPGDKIYDLAFSNERCSGAFADLPPVMNWPVYLNAGDIRKTGRDADNTFMEIPAIIEGTSRIVSSRMSNKDLSSGINFRVRIKSLIYLAVSSEVDEKLLRKGGFKDTGKEGKWRNNSSQIKEYSIWSLRAEADESVHIPSIPADYAVFIDTK